MFHDRKLIRLKGHNYAEDNLYYITICVYNRHCSLGKYLNQEIIRSAIGDISYQYWQEIQIHNKNVELHDFIIMPNQIHGIIEIDNSRVTPVGTCHGMSGVIITNQFGNPISGSVSVIINQFKSSVKRWRNKYNFPDFKWQSRFNDHIIRSYEEYLRISDYIKNNPAKWKNDKWFLNM